MDQKKVFVTCEKCGKKLIERLPNGLWRFQFGRNPDDSDDPVVQITIHGNLQIRCLRKSCRHVNTLNYFPFEEKQAIQKTSV
jgi:hypothetical protein